jgi:hypothetical protein
MKYETPELGALTPAISAIQGDGPLNDKTDQSAFDHVTSGSKEVPIGVYADWE